MKDFELAVSELIQMYRHRIRKVEACDALVRQQELVAGDTGWVDPNDGRPKQDEDEEEDEPKEPEKPADAPAQPGEPPAQGDQPAAA